MPSFTPKIQGTLLAIIWLVAHSLLITRYGIRTFDDTIIYTQAARYLTEHASLADADQIFYCIPIACIALNNLLFPGTYLPLVILQCLVSACATIALYQAARKVFADSRAGFLAAFIYLIWWDAIHWNITIMTESLACSAACFLLHRLAIFKAHPRDYALIILWTCIAICIRPTGIIMALGVLAFLITYHRTRIKLTLWQSLLLYTGIAILLIAAAEYMFTRWDFTDQYKRGNIITYADTIEGTPLYHESMRRQQPLRLAGPETPALLRMVAFVVYNPVHCLKTMFLKIGFLLSGVRPYYSIAHNLYTLTWHLLIYIFSIVGCRIIQPRSLLAFAVTVVVINSLLVGLSTVDWDNRFYIPMVPPLALLAAGGAWQLMKKLAIRREN